MIQHGNILLAETDMILVRNHDNLLMGTRVFLGIDHSTGTPRVDKASYYREEPFADHAHILLNADELKAYQEEHGIPPTEEEVQYEQDPED
jgi:hypothetical protein